MAAPEKRIEILRTRILESKADISRLERVESELRAREDDLRTKQLLYVNATALNESRMRLAWSRAELERSQ
jgi:hypothetical protein